MIKITVAKKYRQPIKKNTNTIICCDNSLADSTKNQSVHFNVPRQKMIIKNKQAQIHHASSPSTNFSTFQTPTNKLQKKDSQCLQKQDSFYNAFETPIKYSSKQIIIQNLQQVSHQIYELKNEECVLNPFLSSKNFRFKSRNKKLQEEMKKKQYLQNNAAFYINNVINIEKQDCNQIQTLKLSQKDVDEQLLYRLEYQHQQLTQNKVTCQEYYGKKVQQLNNNIERMRKSCQQRQMQLSFLKQSLNQIKNNRNNIEN